MLSAMLAHSGIRSNVLEPGLYPSPMTVSAPVQDPRTGHWTLDGSTNGADIPLGRAGLPHEHASSVLYLCGRGAIFANGTTLRVDGGAMQRVSGFTFLLFLEHSQGQSPALAAGLMLQ